MKHKKNRIEYNYYYNQSGGNIVLLCSLRFLAVRQFLLLSSFRRKLNYPSIVKLYGAELHNEGGQVRAILVMELCKEDLRKHILHKNIPGLPSSTALTDRNTIRWAKDIADALEFVHKQGFVHRDLKLENILVRKQHVIIIFMMMMMTMFVFCKILHFKIDIVIKYSVKTSQNLFKNFKNTTTFRRWL